MTGQKILPKLTEKEIEILRIVWEKGAISVKDVHEVMGGDESNGYTTILKLMQIMHEKGHLARQKSGKLHLYKAIASQENTQQQLLDKMIDTVFRGSAAELVMSALGNRKSSKIELKAIREYLDELEKGEK
ncbi:MAG TPA: BlaI/MecI/CopY family transcriptional regulator [Cyclobacteriaceae bacterium]|nr:BlaI/MecI/CopY family transcriptional regulator [Cyclobacteriaceae bacterium]